MNQNFQFQHSQQQKHSNTFNLNRQNQFKDINYEYKNNQFENHQKHSKNYDSNDIVEKNNELDRHKEGLKPTSICNPFDSNYDITQLNNSKKLKNQKNNFKHIVKSNQIKKMVPPYSYLILISMITVGMPLAPIYMFFDNQSKARVLFFIGHLYISSFIFIFGSVYMLWGTGKKGIIQFIMLYFLLDNILLVFTVASIGFVGMMSFAVAFDLSGLIQIIGVPLLNFTLAGHFRIFLKWSILTKCKVLLFKLVLFINAIILFGIGGYFMAFNYQMTMGFYPEIDSKMKDFALLFVFSNFAFFLQLYSSVSGKDKTQDLKYDYEIVDTDSEDDNQREKSRKNYNNKDKKQKQINNNKHKNKKQKIRFNQDQHQNIGTHQNLVDNDFQQANNYQLNTSQIWIKPQKSKI